MWQDLEEALGASPASLALPNAEPLQSHELASQLAAELAVAASAGGVIGPLLVANSCSQARSKPLALARARGVGAAWGGRRGAAWRCFSQAALARNAGLRSNTAPQEVQVAAAGSLVPGEPQALALALRSALEAGEGAPSVLLACPADGALSELRSALAQAAGDMGAYTLLVSTAAEPAVEKRRLLLSTSVGAAAAETCVGATAACDCVCVAQTALLQFSLIFAIFVVMALSGVCSFGCKPLLSVCWSLVRLGILFVS
jgi:hypothetical protein